MKVAVVIVALLSAAWTLLVGLSAYMTTTGLIESSHFLQASIPLVVSLVLSGRLVVRGESAGLAVTAIVIALIPFALLAFVGVQQVLYP